MSYLFVITLMAQSIILDPTTTGIFSEYVGVVITSNKTSSL